MIPYALKAAPLGPARGRCAPKTPARALAAAVAAALALACSPCPALAEAPLTVTVPDAVYTGKAVRPAVAVAADGAPLAHGTDYVLAFRSNVNAGTATVKATGRGAYAGRRGTATFRIAPAPMADAQVSGVQGPYAYTGAAIEPPVQVAFAGRLLVPGRDYTLSFANNVQPGTATATITGTRNLSGTRTVTFVISAPAATGGGQAAGSSGDSGSTASRSTGTSAGSGSTATAKTSKPVAAPKAAKLAAKASLAKARVSVKAATYTGKAQKPKVTVKLAGKALKAGTDFSVKYADNKQAGTAKATVTGKGAYTGSKTAKFKIAKADIAKAKVADIAARYTTGLSKVEPAVSATFKDRKLKAGADFTLKYADNQAPGTASATLKGTGNFKGTKTVKFTLANLGDGLARAACRLSYSRGVFYDYGRYPGTKKYLGLYHLAGGSVKYTAGRSCNVGICTAVRWSGYDASFPATLYNQKPYLGYQAKSAKTTRWTCVGTYKKGDVAGSGLLPGDVLVSERHIWMYVGTKIPKEVYARYLKGTDADLGAPTGCWASSHMGRSNRNTLSAAMGIGGVGYAYADSYGNTVRIYRCVKPADSSMRAGKEAA